MDFELMITSFPKLLIATTVTLKLLSLSLLFGLVIGLLFAVMRMSKIFFLKLHMVTHIYSGEHHYLYKYL